MRTVWYRIILLSVGIITGCAKTPPDMVGCIASCVAQVQNCRQHCHDNCFQCGSKNDATAKRRYTQYKCEQIIQGKMIARDVQSYRDPLQCRKVSCDCEADYRMCRQACAHGIQKCLQVAPICC